MQCQDCLRYFKSQKCFENHKEKSLMKGKPKKKLTICEQLFNCKYCFRFVNLSMLRKKGIRRHICNSTWCDICKQLFRNESGNSENSGNSYRFHHCSVQKYTKKTPEKFTLIFYDIETVQKKEIFDRGNKSQFEHEAILLVTQSVCEKCWNKEESYICDSSHPREQIYEGIDCVSKFLTFLFQYQPNQSVVICMAHNSKAFDGNLILANALRMKNCNFSNIKLVMRGFKLLKIQLKKKIQFIDSLMFIPMPLANFQKTFDLDISLTKGFFPYLFLSFDNWSYEGEIPEKKYFNMEMSSTKRQKEFDSWYEEKTNAKEKYILRNEAIQYCSNDVTLLRHGCLKFMESIFEIAKINPFIECFTLAQLALLIYRKNFMPENKLGIVPRNNYHSNTAQSKICRKWLTYLNYFQPSNSSMPDFFIECEIKLKEGLVVDGYAKTYPHSIRNTQKGTVFEFSGCYFHGCPKCFKTNPYNLRYATDMGGTKMEQKGLFAKQKYHMTVSKLERLTQLGYNVVHMWEHDFVAFLKKNPKLDTEISNHTFVNYSNLNARSAVYGGRTEAGRLYYKTKPGEKIKFYDYCSLYSYSMLTTKYFIGHPRSIQMHKQCDKITVEELSKMNGLAYCEVLPNPKLFFPVLPYRCGGKLKFPSCRSCVENLDAKCTHKNISERSLIGTWSTDELKLAFERGYKLIRLFEVWDYEFECGEQNSKENLTKITYDTLMGEQMQKNLSKKCTRGIFTEYQNKFIQLKAEASGFPNWCQTDDDKRRYIVDFFVENNVILRWEKIQKNQTLRSLAKLMLNSLFGKLIQQEKFISTSILSHPNDLKFYLNSDIHEILDLYCCNDNYIVITWKLVQNEQGEEIQLNPGFQRAEQKNVCITSGIQTTTGARLRLYSEIEKLQDRCFYMDTDSMVFLQRDEKEYCPSLSNAIGGLSNELEDHRIRSDFEPYICEFVCMGPKTYAFCVINEPEDSPTFKKIYVVKCKGLTLTGENAKKINMNLMKSYVLGENFIDHEDELFYFKPFETKRKCIRTLKNFKLVTEEQTRTLKFTFDKRSVKENFITYPYGYEK